MIPRKPGGQPGNQNALKHGFYSRYFSPLEVEELQVSSIDGLNHEVVLLRVMIRRLVALLSDRGDEGDVDHAVAYLNCMSSACGRLANLLKAQRLLVDKTSDLSLAFNQALEDVLLEMQSRPLVGSASPSIPQALPSPASALVEVAPPPSLETPPPAPAPEGSCP
jgi:uncharacterized protein YjcR